MILDTSAIVAIIKQEKGYEKLLEELLAARNLKIGAPTLVELTAVLQGLGQVRLHYDVKALLSENKVEVAPFTEEHSAVAQQAYRDFGRGSGSPAKLNLGDCYYYATAKIADEPLLFIGDDFTHTDV
jgi:ribonuclease VapC